MHATTICTHVLPWLTLTPPSSASSDHPSQRHRPCNSEPFKSARTLKCILATASLSTCYMCVQIIVCRSIHDCMVSLSLSLPPRCLSLFAFPPSHSWFYRSPEDQAQNPECRRNVGGHAPACSVRGRGFWRSLSDSAGLGWF